jgi:DNA-binding MarR family transcriptional regulator
MSMAQPNWLNERESAAWRGYITMSELLRAQLARDLVRETGLSDPDYAVLVQLSEAPDRQLRMSELAARMSWSKSRLSHQVGRMEERGLVQRAECPTDARGSLAVLTDRGFDEIRRAAPSHLASARRHFIDLLNAEQLDALAAIAAPVLDHLRGIGGELTEECAVALDAAAGDCAAAEAASSHDPE